jgi:hypothetical protein
LFYNIRQKCLLSVANLKYHGNLPRYCFITLAPGGRN